MGQGNTGIARAVVQIDCVIIGADCITTWEHHIIHGASPLIRLFWPYNPCIAPQSTDFRMLKVEQRNAKSIQSATGRLSHPMIDHEPAFCGFNGRGGKTNLVGIPPGTTASLKNQPMIPPMAQVW